MRLIAHYVFTAGVMAYVVEALRLPEALLLMTLWSIAINKFIDAAGHKRRGKEKHPTRSWRTHSIYTAPLWGAALTLAPAWLVWWLGLVPTIMGPGVAAMALLGVLAALSHLFLDSLTEAGIYTTPHHRVVLAHLRYDSAVGNGLAVLAGLILLFLAFSAVA